MQRLARSVGSGLVALAVLYGSATPAAAAQVVVLSNTTDWTQSTEVQINDSTPGCIFGCNGFPNGNWPGVSSLPAVGTFTSTPMPDEVWGGIANVDGATVLDSNSGIRFYRTTFALPSFAALSADIQVSVDNDVQIFINGHPVALEGSLSGSNIYGFHHRVFIGTDESVSNGHLGGDSFDWVASGFPSANWVNGGQNELILAVRNLSFGGDDGGFSFGMTIETGSANQAPDVSAASPSIASIWPPNNKMVPITINGVTDADGDVVTITITGITNNETGSSDADGIGTSTAQVRASRNGKGSGRTYTISFTADDGNGGTASGSVTVVVPHDQGKRAKPMAVENATWGEVKSSQQ